MRKRKNLTEAYYPWENEAFTAFWNKYENSSSFSYKKKLDYIMAIIADELKVNHNIPIKFTNSFRFPIKQWSEATGKYVTIYRDEVTDLIDAAVNEMRAPTFRQVAIRVANTLATKFEEDEAEELPYSEVMVNGRVMSNDEYERTPQYRALHGENESKHTSRARGIKEGIRSSYDIYGEGNTDKYQELISSWVTAKATNSVTSKIKNEQISFLMNASEYLENKILEDGRYNVLINWNKYDDMEITNAYSHECSYAQYLGEIIAVISKDNLCDWIDEALATDMPEINNSKDLLDNIVFDILQELENVEEQYEFEMRSMREALHKFSKYN